MADDPIQVRFKNAKSRKRLKNESQKTGIAQVDFIRFALDQLFEKYPDRDALVEAYIRSRSTAKG